MRKQAKQSRAEAPILTEEQEKALARCVEAAVAAAPLRELVMSDPVLAKRARRANELIREQGKALQHLSKIGKLAHAALPHFAALLGFMKALEIAIGELDSDAESKAEGAPYLRSIHFFELSEALFKYISRLQDTTRSQQLLKSVIRFQTNVEAHRRTMESKRVRVERATLWYLERIGLRTGGPRAARVLAQTLRRTVGARIAEDDELRVLQRARARLSGKHLRTIGKRWMGDNVTG